MNDSKRGASDDAVGYTSGTGTKASGWLGFYERIDEEILPPRIR